MDPTAIAKERLADDSKGSSLSAAFGVPDSCGSAEESSTVTTAAPALRAAKATGTWPDLPWIDCAPPTLAVPMPHTTHARAHTSRPPL